MIILIRSRGYSRVVGRSGPGVDLRDHWHGVRGDAAGNRKFVFVGPHPLPDQSPANRT